MNNLLNIKNIINDINLCSNWEEKIFYLLELGKILPLNNINIRNSKYIIYGCYSNTWIKIENKKKIIFLNADSNTLLTKGILTIIIALCNNQNKKYISKLNIIYFFKKIKILKHLNDVRKITIEKIINFIKTQIYLI